MKYHNDKKEHNIKDCFSCKSNHCLWRLEARRNAKQTGGTIIIEQDKSQKTNIPNLRYREIQFPCWIGN